MAGISKAEKERRAQQAREVADRYRPLALRARKDRPFAALTDSERDTLARLLAAAKPLVEGSREEDVFALSVMLDEEENERTYEAATLLD